MAQVTLQEALDKIAEEIDELSGFKVTETYEAMFMAFDDWDNIPIGTVIRFVKDGEQNYYTKEEMDSLFLMA